VPAAARQAAGTEKRKVEKVKSNKSIDQQQQQQQWQSSEGPDSLTRYRQHTDRLITSRVTTGPTDRKWPRHATSDRSAAVHPAHRIGTCQGYRRHVESS
jgi:hypothetical protein